MRALQTSLNRLQQAAALSPEYLKELEDDMETIRRSLETHRKEVEESHQYYTEVTRKCSDKWKRIMDLEKISECNLTVNERDELAVLRNSFNLVIAVDYQMSKLVPY